MRSTVHVIGMALEFRRQTAHRKVGKLELESYQWGWLTFELDAARHVAFERSKDHDSADVRKEAQQFLDLTEWASDNTTPEDLQRLYQ